MRAPEKRRRAVKLTASMAVSFSAARQSSELPAKASIARTVSSRVRRSGIGGSQRRR